MATLAGNLSKFAPSRSSAQAFMDHIYNVKFSKHVPLFMVMCFAVWAVWRTNHYVTAQTGVSSIVGMALALSIELAMLASGAACFITLRESYIRELRKADADRSKFGVYVSYTMLIVTTIALLVLSAADGSIESKGDFAFIALMVMVQFIQSCAVVVFINVADLEERDMLRDEHVNFLRSQTQGKANECPYCFKPLQPNNRQRHIDSCPMKP